MIYEININTQSEYKHMFIIEDGYIVCKEEITIIYENIIYKQKKVKLNRERSFFVLYNDEFYKIQL